MAVLDFDRGRTEIGAQTELLAATVAEADLTAAVPSCPGWNLGQLLRHVGGVHRWVETVVAKRSSDPVDDDLVNDLSVYELDPTAAIAWVREGADRLLHALHDAGPGLRVWTPAGPGSTEFWVRHALHETALHRADAAETLHRPFELTADVAADCFEEWLDNARSPEAYLPDPPLLGPGRTLAFHVPDGHGWLVDLTGPEPTWRRGRATAAASVTGAITDLLLFVYNRPHRVEITGDERLVHLWRERTAFWLEG
ncbi:maleylpyruvate isomerase family mycothiol-dependent enzyme [Nocardia sp. CDC159]|uniref:Maleylpyruvate isomerase family mycothiol-dependent enzyme n=1 Tax=Nocardia pulmonis TaxID=2951408 RepID=A0A9X2E503_9NOCA|nr:MULTISPECIES: maleylpyruvate isomerase family mycothiol-dependent enzyme [Nocardia]MCM6773914.1 maleylpyruvate isomerase family mycothiol-dependent enzyme [Nocardia pulmonis]MCM6786801.1 maleylpyruvate isomerase family mycothiol-dependent enzyme [Nocardia sp. CDC159]